MQTPTTIRFAHHYSLQDLEKHDQSSSTLLILPESSSSTGAASGESIQQPSEPPLYFRLAKDGDDWRASGVLHDFNNQLAIILSHCSIALTKLPLESNARANLDRAIRATKRAADLSSQLQVGMAMQDGEMSMLDITQFVQETLETFEPLIPADVSLDTHYAPNVPELQLNSVLLHRTLLSVLLNAIEALEDSGGQISIATAMVTVADVVTVAGGGQGYKSNIPPGQYVALKISDTGRGMDQETLNQVFTPYYSTKALGTGLGLTLTFHAMQVHRGVIHVQSRPNHGTVFSLLFPI